MYDFHYNFIKKDFDVEFLFIDTDSLSYETKSGDVYEEYFKHKHLLDFSNLPKSSKFLNEANKKVVGKMKTVFERKIIDEFIGLKSKMYSIKYIDGKELGTYEINRKSLSCFDDKSSVSNDGIHTRDYFHKDLKKVFIGKKKQIFTDKKNLKGFS